MAKTIADYKKDYEKARKNRDYVGMRMANAGANLLREKQGMKHYDSSAGDKQYIENRTVDTDNGKELRLSASVKTEGLHSGIRNALENKGVLEKTEKDKGIDLKGYKLTNKSFTPENMKKRDGFVNKRNEMAGKQQIPAISVIDMNKVDPSKLDRTARQTILANNSKAKAAQEDVITSFQPPTIEPPVSVNLRDIMSERINNAKNYKLDELRDNINQGIEVDVPKNTDEKERKTTGQFWKSNLKTGIWGGLSDIADSVEVIASNPFELPFKDVIDEFIPSDGKVKHVLNSIGNVYGMHGMGSALDLLNYASDAYDRTGVGDKAGELISKATNPIHKKYEEAQLDSSLANDTKLREISGNLISIITRMAPDAAIAYVTKGKSLEGTAEKKASKLASKLIDATEELGENPMFWTSFMQMLGPTYKKEIAAGADEDSALTSAVLNATLGSAIEVGGGIQTFKAADKGWRGFIKSALEEGGEEIEQYSTENLISKIFGEDTKEWFSLDKDVNAVINPVAQLEQGAYGVAAGGILGGAQRAVNYGANKVGERKLKKAGSLFEKLGMEEDTSDEGIKAVANAVQEIANDVVNVAAKETSEEQLEELKYAKEVVKEASESEAVSEQDRQTYASVSEKIDKLIEAEETELKKASKVSDSILEEEKIVEQATEPKTDENGSTEAPKSQNGISIEQVDNTDTDITSKSRTLKRESVATDSEITDNAVVDISTDLDGYTFSDKGTNYKVSAEDGKFVVRGDNKTTTRFASKQSVVDMINSATNTNTQATAEEPATKTEKEKKFSIGRTGKKAFEKWAQNEYVNLDMSNKDAVREFTKFFQKWYYAGRQGMRTIDVPFDENIDVNYPPFLENEFYKAGQKDAEALKAKEQKQAEKKAEVKESVKEEPTEAKEKSEGEVEAEKNGEEAINEKETGNGEENSNSGILSASETDTGGREGSGREIRESEEDSRADAIRRAEEAYRKFTERAWVRPRDKRQKALNDFIQNNKDIFKTDKIRFYEIDDKEEPYGFFYTDKTIYVAVNTEYSEGVITFHELFHNFVRNDEFIFEFETFKHLMETYNKDSEVVEYLDKEYEKYNHKKVPREQFLEEYMSHEFAELLKEKCGITIGREVETELPDKITKDLGFVLNLFVSQHNLNLEGIKDAFKEDNNVQELDNGISENLESKSLQGTESEKSVAEHSEQDEQRDNGGTQGHTRQDQRQHDRKGDMAEGVHGTAAGTDNVGTGNTRSSEKSDRGKNQGFVISKDSNLDRGTKVSRYDNNIAAIKLLKEIKDTKRTVTVSDAEVLSKYTGWGGLKEAFTDNNNKAWSDRAEELKNVLSKEEYNAARASTEDAFYTPLSVVFSMYDILNRLGVKGGSVLEPSCGTGYFIGAMPKSMRNNSSITGVELDGITGEIAKLLYPNANIQVKGFQDTNIPQNSVDLVIGNVPFGSTKLYDKQYKQYGKYNIHDYFILKSLDSLREGGIMAVLTTSGTLDKADTEVRKLMSDKANMIGAIRLPSGTFGATDVVTDLLIMQKKKDGVQSGESFISTKEYNGTQINEYFLNHPDMVLGDFSIEKNQYGKLFANVIANDTSIDDVLDKFPKNIAVKDVQKLSERLEEEVSPMDSEMTEDLSDGSLIIRNGQIMRVNENGIPVPWYKVIKSGANKGTKKLYRQDGTEAKRVKGMLELAKELDNVINTQLQSEDNAKLKKAQKKLGEVYDEFRKKYGSINSKANKAVFKSDSRYYKLASLEEETYIDGNKEFVKGPIFSERTIAVNQPITSVDNVDDALALSMNMSNRVNLDYMEELYGKNKNEIVRELGDRIFESPDSEGEFIIAEEYLSGNVREKLKEAEAKAETDPRFEKNVEALRKVQPVHLSAEDISVNIGTPWVGVDTMTDFVNHLFGQEDGAIVAYNPYNSSWTFENRRSNPAADSKWGTSEYPITKMLEAIANKRPINVTTTIEGRSVFNYERTMMARTKADELKEYFKDWIYKDADRRKRLENYYNENYNNLVTRKYDGSYLRMPGSNPKIKLRPHQASAVARVVLSGNTLMAHPVGAGKTFAMIGSIMEMKRLGKAQKPILVVPNHKLGDFMTDFYKMYPNAKLLTVTTEEFNRENRKRMLAKIQTTNFDCIIMRHSSFESFGFSPEYEQAYIQNQIDEVEEAIRAAKTNGMGKRDLTNMSNTLRNLQERLKKEMDRPKDMEAYFDTCGIDALIVDEAHNFKNLAFNTKMGRIAGVQNSNSERARHMHMATEFMNKNNKTVVFATATPVSNSIGELYSMIRYLRPDLLEKYNIKSFDAWADVFGEIISSVEMNTTGSGLRTKERFAKFKNVPELIKIFKVFADIVDKDSLNLKLPEAERIHSTVESSDILRDFNQHIEEKKKNMSNDEAQKGGHLTAMQDARMAALDLRCVYNLLVEEGLIPGYTAINDLDLPDSKINTAVANILKDYKESEDTKGTQIVFLDRGTPNKASKADTERLDKLMKKDEEDWSNDDMAFVEQQRSSRRYSFDLYNDIKQKLIEGGIKPEEIAFIQDTAKGNSDEKKSELFSKVNAGEVRVLIGSTSMMGEGMNAQRKVVSLHQIDAPMRPSDVEQREGRAIRQGNENETVKLYNYSTLNSYDAPTWEMLARKNRSINQIMKGDESIREIEDLSDDPFANMSIEAANNPLMFERKDVEDRLKTLRFKKKNHQAQQHERQYILDSYPKKIKEAKDRRKILQTVQDILNEKHKEMVVDGNSYEKMIEASTALKEYIKTLPVSKERVECGSFRGLKLYVQKTSSVAYNVSFEYPIARAEAVLGEKDGGYESEYKTDTVFLRLNNRLEETQSKIDSNVDTVKGLEKVLEDTKKTEEEEFPYNDEINELQRRLNEIDMELNGQGKNSTETNTQEGNANKEIQAKTEFSMRAQNNKSSGLDLGSDEKVTSFYKPSGKTYEVMKNIEVKKVSDERTTPHSIITDMANELEVSTTAKRFRRPHKVKGFFLPQNMQVRLRDLNDIDPAMHEFGHLFDTKYKFTKTYRKEFNNMLKAPNIKAEMTERGYKESEMLEEVMADFMLLYMTDPNGAYELGSFAGEKNFFDIFEETLNKADLKTVQKYRNRVLYWRSLNHREKVKRTNTSIYNKAPVPASAKEVRDIVTDSKRTVMEWLFDKDNIFKEIGATVKDKYGMDIPADKDPYLKVQFARTSANMSNAIITEKLRNMRGEVIGKGFLEMISPLYKSPDGKVLSTKEMQERESDFNVYLRDVHAIEWMEQGKRTYNSDMSDRAEIEACIAELEKENPDFPALADELHKWWNTFTDTWLVETGLVGKETMEYMRKLNPMYVPTFRKQYKNGRLVPITSPDFNNKIDPIMRASEKGSTNDTYEPLESFMREIERYVDVATKREVGLALHHMYGTDENPTEFTEAISQFMVKVPPEMHKQVFNATGLKASLEGALFANAKSKMTAEERAEFESKSIGEQFEMLQDLGFDNVIDSVINDTIEYYTSSRISNDKEVMAVSENGKTHFYYITDTHLAKAISGFNSKQLPTILRIFKAATNTFSMLTTSMNPLFILPNFARDIQQGITAGTSKYGALNPMLYIDYAKDLSLAFKDIITQSEAHKMYRATSGFDSKTMHDRNSLERAMRKALPSHRKGMTNRIKMLVDGVEFLNSVFEESNRLVEFKRAYKETGDVQEASYRAKDVTGNFRARGYAADFFGCFIPFYGAGMAGIDKARRMALTKEGRTGGLKSQLARSVSMYAMFAIAMALAHFDDEDYWALPDYVRDSYFLIKYDKGKYIRIPKNRELAALFGTSFERALAEVVDPKTENGKAAWAAIFENWMPPHDNILKSFVDASNNKTWSGGTILNSNEETLADGGYYDEVYDDTTSVLAVWLAGKLPDIKGLGALNTPKGIEYVMKQQLGVIAQLGLPYTRPVNDGIGAAIKQKFTTDTVFSNRWQNDFYDTFNHLKAWKVAEDFESEDDTEFKDLPAEEQWRKMYYNASEELSDLRKELKAVSTDRTLDKDVRSARTRDIRIQMNNVASKVQKMYEEALNEDGSVNAPNLSDDEAAYEYDMKKAQQEKYDTEVKPLGISKSDYYKAWKAQSGNSEYDGKKNKTNFERAVNIIGAVPENKLDAYREIFKLNKSDILKAKDAQRLGVTPAMVEQVKAEADLIRNDENDTQYNNGSVDQKELTAYFATRNDLTYEQKELIDVILRSSTSKAKARYGTE